MSDRLISICHFWVHVELAKHMLLVLLGTINCGFLQLLSWSVLRMFFIYSFAVSNIDSEASFKVEDPSSHSIHPMCSYSADSI